MKALVYLGPNKKSLMSRSKPEIWAPTDAIVKIIKTAICGTDLHILKGGVPSCYPGLILGHEGIGIIEQVGADVSMFNVGDKVLISCITACGKCEFCKKSMFSHCANGGWLLGNKIDGTQAEFVRIPYAETSLYPVADNIDEDALVMLSDILPTGFECGVLNGKIRSGGVVAIVGAGPIGLAALLQAQYYSPSQIIMIDVDTDCLEAARLFGATSTVHNPSQNVPEVVMEMTSHRGVDTAIDAVGIPATFELCEKIITHGGIIANIGVQADVHLMHLWDRSIDIPTCATDTFTARILLNILRAHKINSNLLIKQYFNIDDILDAYDVFGSAINTQTLKVIVEA